VAKPKRNVFALLGWLVWKLLSLFGVKFAKKKLGNDRSQGQPARR